MIFRQYCNEFLLLIERILVSATSSREKLDRNFCAVGILLWANQRIPEIKKPSIITHNSTVTVYSVIMIIILFFTVYLIAVRESLPPWLLATYSLGLVEHTYTLDDDIGTVYNDGIYISTPRSVPLVSTDRGEGGTRRVSSKLMTNSIIRVLYRICTKLRYVQILRVRGHAWRVDGTQKCKNKIKYF